MCQAPLRERRRPVVLSTPNGSPFAAAATVPAPPLSVPSRLSLPERRSNDQPWADKARRRYFSEDLHTRARRFGPPISFALTVNDLTARRQLEVVVHTKLFKPSKPPLRFVIELRRLAFWTCMLLLVASAGAFRVMPRGPMPRSALASTTLPSSNDKPPPVQAQVAAEVPRPEKGMAPPQLGRTVRDEAALQMGNVGAGLGVDSFDVAALSSQVLTLFSEGEFTLDKMKILLSRACLSALMHKVVGTGVTLASCALHH